MTSPNPFPQHPEREAWDVIVIGTGMGGGTVGYALARLGRRVLFLEKGLLLHGGHQNPGAGALLRSGHWPERMRGTTSFGPVDFFAPLGCGTGGSTGLYSAQLERFRAADFSPRGWYPDAPDANLPEIWPVTLEEMVPFYRQAEELFGVFGTPDPLEPDPDAPLKAPPAMSPRDSALFESLGELGLHPYRSHVAVAHIENCLECDEVCMFACKSDAGNRCMWPALIDHGASLLPQCDALCLLSEGRRVTGVLTRWRGRELTLRAPIVVVAAGAWMTPLLLLNSRSAEWPDGLANSSGMVGRNLMLHATDFLTVDPGADHSATGPRKAFTVNDFYDDDGHKLGTFQSVGHRLDRPVIESWLRAAAERDAARWKRSGPRFAARVARMAARRFGAATLMATIMEDLPYPENRVVADAGASSGLRFEYRYTEELYRRSRLFQRRLIETLSPKMATHVMPFGRNNINYGHVCGTCRFGDDPRRSVLDAANRAHDLDNLYVVDGSFFPSSGATNPSLTIAANALRVGGIINERL
ncbi:MAG TPA: GMC family oxidoreductase [Allosphingosinicella sp.]|nr:GMC family oxidoreductase [Allosphingosinicella sp.]